MNLEQLSFLIAGQLKTSRTETLEHYYRNRVRYLGIIGISNPFAVKGLARCTLYDNGKRIKEFPLFSVQLKGIYWLSQLLMGPVFLLYAVSMFKAVFRLKKKFNVFIGIACFSTLFGIFLKKLGVVRNVVYYTLDYYPLPVNFHINTLINKTIWHLDKYCCKHSSMVWNISPRIPEARERLMNFTRNEYKYVLAPLTYGKDLLRFRPQDDIETNTLVFVGTLSWSQGLQLVVEAVPDIVKIKPDLKIRIIGKGPDGERIKNMINDRKLNNRFIFHGFVEKEEDVLEIISRCAVGICPWVDEIDNNVIYADPGKPKLYAFCGIPIVITRIASVAEEIDKLEAGIAINYDKQQFIEAVLRILKDGDTLKKYRKNSHIFAMKYTTESVFSSVNKELLDSVGNHMSD